jgi:hypothetical protein
MVVCEGLLSGVNTGSATAGQSVWLSSTAGGFVFNAPPAKPAHSVYLGVVIRAHSVNGEILVKVQNGYELNELHDVNAGSPADNNVLAWDSATSMWTNQTAAQAGLATSASPTFTGTVTTPLTTAGYVKTTSGGVISSSAAVPQADVTNLVSDLAGKAPTSHTHTQSQVTNLTTDLAAKAPIASPTFTGTVTTGAAVDIIGGNMTAVVNWSEAQLELQASSTGSAGLTMHSPGSSTASLRHPRGTQAIEISGNTGVVDNSVKSIRNMFVSTGDPSGGISGDVWLKYTP